ncbi:hypothetical protein Bbelb_131650, partial [Branchiostoma belcheri]
MYVVAGCSSPPYPSGAWRRDCSWPYTEGEVCTYTCFSGYEHTSGNTTRTCSGGQWTGDPIVCERTSVKTILDGKKGTDQISCTLKHSSEDFTMLRLKVQLTLVLIAALVWQSEAWWSRRSTRRTSSSVCPNPPTGFGAMQTGCGWPYEEGETCEFVCRDGYRRTSGDTSRNCNGGTWTGQTLVCEYTGCGRLPYSPGAWRTGCYWPYTDGENCTFYCGEGYIEVSGNYTVTCQDGAWSGTPLTCEY